VRPVAPKTVRVMGNGSGLYWKGATPAAAAGRGANGLPCGERTNEFPDAEYLLVAVF
jgi:hypothetical protein